ncbi:WD repeat-containing protein YMR102C-like isoform X2 [Curcuma longa]|uniref:WD repeat-containing protein YMR102C-like isoform X2 n=1 Tax=Curcuma longa TaxID=136217 RepID=UPI003D9EA77A
MIDMMSLDGGEDKFFDANNEISNSINSLSSDNSLATNQQLLRSLDYELWTSEPMSVQDRRKRFFRRIGFDELVPSSVGCSNSTEVPTVVSSEEHLNSERITNTNGSVLDPLSSADMSISEDSFNYIRDLDTGRKFVIHDVAKDGVPSIFKELGSNKLMTLHDFENATGMSPSVQRYLRRELVPCGEITSLVPCGEITACTNDAKKSKYLKWWRCLIKRKPSSESNNYYVSVKKPKISKSVRTKVFRYKKKCMEFTALYLGQEIQAHKGMITTMKFSPNGRYLASGGEDCAVHVWQIVQVENSCRFNSTDGSLFPPKLVDKIKVINMFVGKCHNSAPVFIPKKIFKIEETPLHELKGHTGDILDLSWSQADCLLTSSKDKTVRMWKVGCPECLKIFQHNDYVTCIQFNPIQEQLFVSGSIDGKVRIWEIQKNRVIDWVDVRDMVTAICYQPDGKGFVVGSIKGNCKLYDCLAKPSQLALQFCLLGKKKSSGKRITGFQFFPGDSKRIMITSADSLIRICDGPDVVQKFKGPRKSKCHLSASFSSDGRHIVSVGEDSNVYIWSYDKLDKQLYRGAKLVRASEFFYSEGASIAVLWPGMVNEETITSDNLQVPTQHRRATSESIPWLKNPDCISLGAWLFPDGSSRSSATWPEEKLSCQTKLPLQSGDTREHCLRLHRDCWSLTPKQAGAWSTVIVTAGNDGAIRSFHNFGLPVRL